MAGLASYGTKKISGGGVASPELKSTLVNNYKNDTSYAGIALNADEISISFDDIEDAKNREITNSLHYESAEPEKPWYEKLWDGVKSTGATIAVGATSIVSGIADIGEAAVDGVTWVGGKVVEGGSWLVGETVGLVNEDAKADIMEWREDAKADVRDFISTDWVDEANQALYENTSIGQAINDASYMKYDSELAQKIEGISTSVGEIAIATGATIVTGGAAAPLVCGTLVGFGNSAETMYQGNPDSSGLTELMILGTGGLNGVAWAANGKLGASFVTEFGKSLGEVGFKQTATNLGQSFTQPEFLKSWLKQSLTDKGNYISSAMMSADDVIGFITGEKEVNAENLAMVGVGFLENFGLNTLEDGVRLGIGGFKAPSTEAILKLEALDASVRTDFFDSNCADSAEVRGTYGIDQDACSRLLTNRKNNNDWIGDENKLIEYLKKEFPNKTDAEILKDLEFFKTSPTVNDFTKNFVISYLQETTGSYDEAYSKFLSSFTIEKSEMYDKLIAKYVGMGLSEKDAAYLLSNLNSVGACSYAAYCNIIAYTFAKNPEKFKEIFGYDLYRTLNGQQVLNAPELLSDLYVFANTEGNGGSLFTLVDGKLSLVDRDFKNQNGLSTFLGTKDAVISNFLKSKDSRLSYTDQILCYQGPDRLIADIKDSNDETVVQSFIEQLKTNLSNGEEVRLGIYSTPQSKFSFLRMDGSVEVTTNDWQEGGAHAVYVTDVVDDGIIVSSWGTKLKINFTDFMSNKFNMSWGIIHGIE